MMKEEKATDSNFLDSSIWLAYFLDGHHKEVIESEKILFISTLSLFEIKKKLSGKKIPDKIIKEKLKFIKERAISLDLDSATAEQAAEISIKHKLPAIDSLVYATAIYHKAKLMTLDNDFRGLDNVELLN